MDAIPVLTYQIVDNPKPEKIGTIELYSNFDIPIDMEPTNARSSFSCSLLAKELIEDNDFPRKAELYNFLTNSGVEQNDALMLISKFIQLACEVTSSVVDSPHYSLLMLLNLFVFPSYEESDLDDFQFEDEYEGFKSEGKIRVMSLSRRTYKRKRETSSIVDKCTICLGEFVTGREVATLPCGHEFDIECIVEWFRYKHVCPLCRFELPIYLE